MQPIELTVKQLNFYVRSLLEGDANLSALTLVGELSNFKNHYSSGHWYFVLKDQDAAVRGVMFQGNAKRVDFVPKDGMRVVCRGYVSLYERDGQFQFYAESMRPFGQGDLAAEFERVKRKLESEGLFSPERKRPIPSFPKKLGVITSDTGAALQDILQILSRRYRLCDVVIFPALVQGAAAPESLIAALKAAYRRQDLDLLMIGRGGGSAEDLSCFNDEMLARVLAQSPVPVISAVGHETDFTICDFVCDLRAPTPSAAAELAVPSAEELAVRVAQLEQRVKSAALGYVERGARAVESLLDRRCFKHPEQIFSPFEMRLDGLLERLESAYLLRLRVFENRFSRLRAGLDALSPQSVLDRGFSLVYRENAVVTDADSVNPGDLLRIRFAKGEACCTVQKTDSDIAVSKRQKEE